jgi:toxin-antitoxin system PIN domain toxin
VIILDANILLYAYNADASHHLNMRTWLEHRLDASDPIGIPWVTLWSFLRISTNPRLTRLALGTEEVFQAFRELLANPQVSVIEPGPRHAEILEQLVRHAGATGPRVTDAALAALAIEYGATLASTDRDFSRFPDLRWINPLASA